MILSFKPSHLRVYTEVAALLIKYAPFADLRNLLQDEQLSLKLPPPQDCETSDDAEAFARDLEKRGPAFVKFGQLLSTRADLLPPDWLAALQRLQDQVEPFPYRDVARIVEEDLGVGISSAFAEFDETPLASASLGQVHRAVLRNGEMEVAVKVQRPDIREQLLEDLGAIAELAAFLEKHSAAARRYRFADIAREARKQIVNELDYRQESRNLIRLARNLRKYPHLTIPAPVPDYCGRRVLTMDYVKGSRITDLSGVVRLEVPGDKLAEELFESYLQQVLVDGFFHADPHPGNVLLTRDHKIALIDLGMVGHISESLRGQLLALLAALGNHHGEEAARIAIKIGRPGDNFQPAELISALADLVNARAGASVSGLKIGTTIMQITNLCGHHHLRIPHEMFMLGKMLLNLDMVGEALDPDFCPDEAIRRNTAKLARLRMRDTLTSGSLLSLVLDAKELLARTPHRINEVLNHLANNRFKVEVDAIDEVGLLRGFEKIANRITVGVILGALIIGAAMLMHIETGFTVLGYPGIAMIFFLIASIGGLLLAWRILFRSGEREDPNDR